MELEYFKYCNYNYKIARESASCCCAYCKEIYPGTDIYDYYGSEDEPTAFCPKCGVDAVIPSKTYVPTDEELNRWYVQATTVKTDRYGNMYSGHLYAKVTFGSDDEDDMDDPVLSFNN